MAQVSSMMIPLRLQQTRFKKKPSCLHEGHRLSEGHRDRMLWIYPGRNGSSSQASANAHMYPVCGSDYEKSTETYGPGTKAFTYTPQSENSDHDYLYCGARDRLTSATKCYDSAGYILDLHFAREFRTQIDELLSGGWLDDLTESVAVHMQLANMQTGCMVFVIVMFEFMTGGNVHTTVDYGVKCERPGAP